MISLEELKKLTTLQKLPENVGDVGKLMFRENIRNHLDLVKT